MKGFILSFRSEFYKTRKTAAFWSAIVLPLLICGLIFTGFFLHADKIAGNHVPPMMLWLEFAGAILGIMGVLILPILIVFIAYSVNSIEHKADTWKTLFSLPISKLSVYAAKYMYGFFLLLLCLTLFASLTYGFGNLLGTLKPALKFHDYSVGQMLTEIYFKLFLSSLGILSIQFLLSLLFRDFLKPMGIGFAATVGGIIMVNLGWDYAYLFPYAHPMLVMQLLPKHTHMATATTAVSIDIFTKEVFVSLIVSAAVFIGGYVIVLKKSVK
jgi:lantibiotic transport system permease protein